MTSIRWRNCDPAEHQNYIGATAWTRVHVLQNLPADATRFTLCGIEVPDYPYLEDIDLQIPSDVPRCKSCRKAATR